MHEVAKTRVLQQWRPRLKRSAGRAGRMPFSDAGSPRNDGMEGDLTVLVQSLRVQLETAAQESAAVLARVAALEAAAPEVTAERLAALEASVEASITENLERDMQQAEDMLAWDESVSTLEARVELLEGAAPASATPAAATPAAATPAAATPAAAALSLEVATEADDGDDDDDGFAEFVARCHVQPQAASEANSVGSADAAEKQAAVLWVSTLKRLTDVELRVAATEVMARNQHV